MIVLSFIYRYGIWISVPAFISFLVLFILSIAGVVRTMRQARLFSAPLLPTQEVVFTETGRVVLAMEGPFFSRRFVKLEYELIGPDGMTAESRPAFFHARSSSLTKARMELRVYDVVTPGRYAFQIGNLEGEKPSDAEHSIVFTRPHLGQSIAYVFGIVFTAMFTIGSIVLFFIRLAGV